MFFIINKRCHLRISVNGNVLTLLITLNTYTSNLIDVVKLKIQHSPSAFVLQLKILTMIFLA